MLVHNLFTFGNRNGRLALLFRILVLEVAWIAFVAVTPKMPEIINFVPLLLVFFSYVLFSSILNRRLIDLDYSKWWSLVIHASVFLWIKPIDLGMLANFFVELGGWFYDNFALLLFKLPYQVRFFQMPEIFDTFSDLFVFLGVGLLLYLLFAPSKKAHATSQPQ